METLFKENVTVKKFIKFVWPSVLMMIVIALYYGIDSVFIANLVGERGLAALSISYPAQGLMWGVSVMLAAGSSAVVAIKMGEGRQEEADRKFTLICAVSVVTGAVFTVIFFFFLDPIIGLLGASPVLEEGCREFLSILLWGYPGAFLGVLFEYFIRVDGRPGFTLCLYIIGGVVHLVLDYVFMGPMDMGIRGAAYANIAGLYAVMLVGLFYFLFMDTKLNFRRFRNDWRFVGHCFVNGSSEFVSESSAGIVTFFFNMMVIRLVGETGVAAVSIILNVHYLLISIFLGYITGVAPLISYYYGAGEYGKVNTFLRYSKVFIIATSLAGAVICFLLSPYIVMIYERPGSELYELALYGTRLLSMAILLCGVNIFASGFFTAYGNGIVSAFISLSRGLILVIAGLFILGNLLGMTGVWLTLTFAEAITLVLTGCMYKKYKEVYHYSLK